MELCPHEIELVGKWIVDNGAVRGDAVCERIEWLTSNSLKKLPRARNRVVGKLCFRIPGMDAIGKEPIPMVAGMEEGRLL